MPQESITSRSIFYKAKRESNKETDLSHLYEVSTVRLMKKEGDIE